MTRGLPFSILIHILVLALVMVYGNAVQRAPVRTPHSIRVQMVQLPQASPVQDTPPAEEVVEPPPVVVEETVPDLPPKELPQEKPEPEMKPEPKVEKPEPKPDPVPAEQQPVDQMTDTSETDAGPAVAGPSVQGTDVDFPYAWYLARVQGQIARNWNPKQLGFRSRSVVSCVVHFTIHQNGRVSQVTLTRPSGVGVFDREALRVVQSSRIPPLPPGFSSSTLGVSMKFNLESGV